MSVAIRWASGFALALVALLIGGSSLYAQEGSSAGLVIVPAEGAAQTYCVDLDAEATGWDLLVGAGLAVNSEPTAMGQSICSIDGVGCKSPQQSCFCQCQGSPCVYWSFWTQDETGEWVYSNQGASGAKVRAGEVQGWVWGDGTTGKAPAPPSVSFGDICAADDDLAVGASVVSTSVVSESVVGASTPEYENSKTPDYQATESQTSVGIEWSLLIVLLPLPVILGLYLWRRR